MDRSLIPAGPVLSAARSQTESASGVLWIPIVAFLTGDSNSPGERTGIEAQLEPPGSVHPSLVSVTCGEELPADLARGAGFSCEGGR
jgi:hypothetical protein